MACSYVKMKHERGREQAFSAPLTSLSVPFHFIFTTAIDEDVVIYSSLTGANNFSQIPANSCRGQSNGLSLVGPYSMSQ